MTRAVLSTLAVFALYLVAIVVILALAAIPLRIMLRRHRARLDVAPHASDLPSSLDSYRSRASRDFIVPRGAAQPNPKPPRGHAK